MLGTWIDSLTDEERDRIVRAQKWRGGAYVWDDGARCLLGHVGDAKATGNWSVFPEYGARADTTVAASSLGLDFRYASRFDRLIRRFGLDRVVRAIKKRAGAKLDDSRAAGVGDGSAERIPCRPH